MVIKLLFPMGVNQIKVHTCADLRHCSGKPLPKDQNQVSIGNTFCGNVSVDSTRPREA